MSGILEEKQEQLKHKEEGKTIDRAVKQGRRDIKKKIRDRQHEEDKKLVIRYFEIKDKLSKIK